jgi:diguanylate cyclase (GGDEF)-like protein
MRFRLQLTLTLLVFSLVLSFLISFVDQFRMLNQTMDNNEDKIRHIEYFVAHAVSTVEKAYRLYGKELDSLMEQHSRLLRNWYMEEPDLDRWDFQALKQQLGFDIYMINEQNIVTHSSFIQDIGLDFNECCAGLAQILNERRASGKFVADGLDIEQNTGQIKKYSYLATHDKKYLIQLGYNVQGSKIFEEFNFYSAIDQLLDRYSTLNDIHILNTGGLLFGATVSPETSLPAERREAFEQTLRTGQTTEVRGEWNGEPAVYRYVYYSSKYDSSATQTKVFEIIYNEHELQQVMRESTRWFVWQTVIVLLVTIVLSWLLSRWLSRPMYLAYHDSLTGLGNRSFLERFVPRLLAEHRPLAYVMIDLDHFKSINDTYGHDAGDRLLREVARRLAAHLRKGERAFRLGGDEFVIIMPGAAEDDVERTIDRMIRDMEEEVIARFPSGDGMAVTISAGVAMAPADGQDLETLGRHADVALYEAKKGGRNQYRFYRRVANPDPSPTTDQ